MAIGKPSPFISRSRRATVRKVVSGSYRSPTKRVGTKLSSGYRPSATSRPTTTPSLAPPKPPSGIAPQSQPFDPATAIRLAQARAGHDTTQGDLTADLSSASTRLGFNVDPTSGQVSGIDPNNPFSNASLLQRNYDFAKNKTTNQFASQGQLYSGAYQGQQGLDTSNYNQGYNALQNQLQDLITRYLRNRRNNDANLNNTQAIAPFQSLQNAVNNSNG